MVFRRISTLNALRSSMSSSSVRGMENTGIWGGRDAMGNEITTPSSEAMDLEDGRNNGKSPRTTRHLGRRLSCQSDRNSGLIVLAALQMVAIFVLAVHLHRGATAVRLQYRPRVQFVNNEEATKLSHLIMVPGHGVTITESLDGADSRDDPWFLLDYQKNKDVPRALVGHIRRALEELEADSSALLLFSGGKTRVVAGPKSEGESYFFVADHFNWWGKPELRARASTEDFARDSFENLLFSLCRFNEVTGNYPAKVTVVGYDFKETRFMNLHRMALRLPSEALDYIGLHPDGRFDNAAAQYGERVSALEPYKADPYGCDPNGPLIGKRTERNPFHRTSPYTVSCPEMRDLLDWCGPDLFEGDLPWFPEQTGKEPPGV